jgi:hypothetical protein
MRKLSIMCAAVMLAACAIAEINAISAVIAVGTNDNGAVTLNRVRGEIESIEAGASTTGLVAVAYTPLHGFGSVDILAASAVDTNAVYRPTVVTTRAVVSPDLTSTNTVIESVSKYALDGETVTVSITGSETGKIWRVFLKTKQ